MADKQASTEERLNTIRAGILGSNDGILTVVGVVFSVAAASSNHLVIILAALSDLLACALSMGSGEYAAVSAQRDAEKVVQAKEEGRLGTAAGQEQLASIQSFYEDRGVSTQTAALIAADLYQKKPLATVLSVKYDLTLGRYVSPLAAAFSSTFSAALGGALPLLALLLFPQRWQYPAAILATVLAVSLTGFIAAKLSAGRPALAVYRNIWIGLVTIAIHFGIGLLF
ncbi:VIT1/CCC1 transporter family protein [Leuconostocaceae bacterium ESL0958]|nr:VIT1/CCC1 transporter family protein [Leuconostocaceae bacterium ESL0958]